MTGLLKSGAHPVSPVFCGPAEPTPAPMRIGIVTHYMTPHLGGIETVAEALFEAFGAAGNEVRWVASRIPATLPSREGGRIRIPTWNGLERRLGVPWPVWGPIGAREVTRLVGWADVLHVHDCLYLGSALAVLLARRARKPVVLSQHIGLVQYRSRLLSLLERLAYRTLGRAVLRGATHVVFCTVAAEQFVPVLLGRQPAAATSIPYGIDTRHFRPPTAAERAQARQRLGLPATGQVVLFVGRLVEKKGVPLVLEVGRRMPLHRFLLVGDGPLRSALKADNLTWIPSVSPPEMARVYQAADAFLLPSYGEGFPLSVLEAMATELPVIVSEGQPFTARLKEEGACVTAERTPTALSRAVSQLSEGPEAAALVARRARELVVREWSVEAMVTRYLGLMRELVPGR